MKKKKNPTNAVTVRFSDEMYAKLKQLAEANDRSLAKQVLALIKAGGINGA